MNNTMLFTGHGHRFPVTTTTTTTTTSYGPIQNNFCNGSSAYNPANCNNGVQLSSKAQMLMKFMQMMDQLMGGSFGQLMSSLGVGPGAQGQMHPFSNAHPGFGDSQMNPFANMHPGFGPTAGFNSGGGMQGLANATKNGLFAAESARAPQAPAGQATEMKAGQTMKAPNGSLVTWGQDGNVGIKYKDANGQLRNISVKDGMMSMDGGKPTKLENVGQLLKLPNGDVVGLGNNPSGPAGKQLCRVVVANNADQIKTEPASATNIYDIKNMQHTHRGFVPAMANMNINASSYNGFNGSSSFLNANISMLTGIPYEYSHTVQELMFNGVK